MADVAVAYSLVLVAELGDKTQVVAFASAARHGVFRTVALLAALLIVLQTLSVTLGAAVATVVPAHVIGIGAGLAFLGFAAWTWWGGRRTDGEDGPSRMELTMGGVAAAFLLAELGDKTMFATASLAADRGAAAVWFGSLAAMLTATVAAVAVGQALANRVSTSVMRRLSTGAFAVAGILTLVSAI